jgi:PAS domain-containing protein
MKLKFLFFFLALLLTAVWTILLVLTLKERGALFYIGEGVITFSLVFLVYFYRKVVKPLDIIGNGMELLREQDFSSRLTPVGQKEADRIVLVFNRMMEQLKDERLRLHEQNHFLDLLVSASPMGVVILTLDGHISMLNAAALRFLDYSSSEEVRGRLLCELASPLAEEIERIPKDTTETIRLSDSMIYRCSRLSFVDRGFSHPFILVESLTSEVVKAKRHTKK